MLSEGYYIQVMSSSGTLAYSQIAKYVKFTVPIGGIVSENLAQIQLFLKTSQKNILSLCKCAQVKVSRVSHLPESHFSYS